MCGASASCAPAPTPCSWDGDGVHPGHRQSLRGQLPAAQGPQPSGWGSHLGGCPLTTGWGLQLRGALTSMGGSWLRTQVGNVSLGGGVPALWAAVGPLLATHPSRMEGALDAVGRGASVWVVLMASAVFRGLATQGPEGRLPGQTEGDGGGSWCLTATVGSSRALSSAHVGLPPPTAHQPGRETDSAVAKGASFLTAQETLLTGGH